MLVLHRVNEALSISLGGRKSMVDEKTALASARAQMIYDANKKSQGVTYLLWLFLGGIGAHRFYIGRPATGAVYLVLWLSGWVLVFPFLAVFLWWVVDGFLIPDMIRKKNMSIADSFAFD